MGYKLLQFCTVNKGHSDPPQSESKACILSDHEASYRNKSKPLRGSCCMFKMENTCIVIYFKCLKDLTFLLPSPQTTRTELGTY